MHRALLLLAALVGCGTDPDSRPVTFEVVTLEVLAPTCGQVQCHSATTNTAGYALDTLDGARAAMKDGDLLQPEHNDPRSRLEKVLHASGGDRMPPDSPLNTPDLDLIDAWLAQGEPGL